VSRVPNARRQLLEDGAVALVLSALAVAELLQGSADEWQLAVAVLGTVPLVLRRRFPLFVLAALVVALTILTAQGIDEFPVAELLALMIATYTVAAARSTAVATVGLGLALGGAYANSAAASAGAGDYVFASILLTVPWFAGLALRQWRRRAEQLEALTVQLQNSRQEHAQLLVQTERLGIARDLHDSIAQTLNAVVVHAEVAEAAIGDDDVVRHSLARIREVARGSLAEIRQLVGSLRGEQTPGEQPALSDLRLLVESLEKDGQMIEVVERGQPVPGSPEVDTVAYRVIHEGLVNAHRHARGAQVVVTITHGPDLLLEVRNPVARESQGTTSSRYGLTGMRERVQLVGGDLDAGPEGADFVVRARLPQGIAS